MGNTTENSVIEDSPKEDSPKKDSPKEDNKQQLKLEEKLAKLQAKLAAQEEEAAAYKLEVERSKLSEDERLKAELAEAKEKADSFSVERERFKEQLQRERDISALTTQGLTNIEFGEVVLRHREEEEDITAFAERMKADPAYSALFGKQTDVDVRTPSGQTEVTGKQQPANKTGEITQDDREFAERMFRGNAAKQQTFLKNLERERGRRK